jgi:phosphate-selective porin
MTYDNDLTMYVLQIDVIPTGVTLKDAYATIREPWTRDFSLTAGVFDRPFGFEISYSSSMRESPERSRLFQTLFPGERDLGVKLEFAPEKGPLSLFNAKVGLFSGNRGTIDETDNAKDIIGRVGVSLPFTEENLAIDAGVSGYFGSVRRDDNTKIYKISSISAIDSSEESYADRTYIGADVQIYYDLPVLGGFSIRGEFISGKQPGSSGSNGYHAVGAGSVYLRNFMGYYLMYVQNIGQRFQFIAKYDVYDPNTDIGGDEINTATFKLGPSKAAAFGAADIKYSTFGLGAVYHWDSNVKFVLYYDMVYNETSAKFGTYGKDLRDNVLTCRMQYSF